MSKWRVLMGTGLACLFIGIDVTIANMCLPSISRSLMVHNQWLPWVISAFAVMMCALMVPGGRAADQRGCHRVFYVSTSVFMLASLSAGFSHSMSMLVISRAVQGAAAGFMFPAGLSGTARAFADSNQARGMSLFVSVLGIGLVLGPILGSVILTLASWRWVFFINVPAILLAWLICGGHLAHHQSSKESIDIFGAVLLIVMIVALMFYINQAPMSGWLNPVMLVSLLMCMVAGFVFFRHERRSSAPIVPPQLFARRKFLLALCNFTPTRPWVVVFLTPLLLHDVVRLPFSHIGFYMMLMTLMTVVVPFLTDRVYTRWSTKILLTLSSLCSLLGLMLFAIYHVGDSIWHVIIALILLGAAWGSSNSVAIPYAVSSDKENPGLLSGALITVGDLLNVVFLVSISSVLWWRERKVFYAGLGGLRNSLTGAQEKFLHVLLSMPGRENELSIYFPDKHQRQFVDHLFRHAFSTAQQTAFLCLAVITFLALVFSFWLMRSVK